MKQTFNVEMIAQVRVVIEDPDDVVGRVLENREGWRENFYELKDLNSILEMFAFNALANGETDVSRLDGWGDLDSGVATMRVTEAFIDRFSEEP